MPKRNTENVFYSMIERTAHCWLWQGTPEAITGYGRFTLNGKRWRVHCLMWTLSFGEIPKGLCVCHTCDNRLCVNPSHFFLGTSRENALDMWMKGRNKPPAVRRGVDNNKARLTEIEVLSIRSEYIPRKVSCTILGRKYGIDRTIIHDIYCHQKDVETHMRVAIIGSRLWPLEQRHQIDEYVRSLPADTVVVSGGASGVDTWAVEAAIACGLAWVEHPVSRNEYRLYGKKMATMRRNQRIVDDSDEVVAFCFEHSNGTEGTMRMTRVAGKKLTVFSLDRLAEVEDE